MVFRLIIITLDSCYILVIVAFCFLLLSSTRLWSNFSIRARRLLILPTSILIGFGIIPFSNKSCIGRTKCFFRCYSSISRWVDLCKDLHVFRINRDELYTFSVIGLTCECPNHIRDLLLRNFSPSSLKVTNHGTHGLQMFGYSTGGVHLVLIFFKCKVRSLVVDVWPNLTLNFCPTYL